LEDLEKEIYFDFNQNSDFEFSTDQFDYKFDICSGIKDQPGCEGSAICRKNADAWESLGTLASVEVFKELELASSISLEMKISDGRPCAAQGKKFTTTIWFSCNMNDEVSKPVVVSTGNLTCFKLGYFEGVDVAD
jgi:hypothetical protein